MAIKKITIISFLIAVAIAFNFLNSSKTNATVAKFHTPEEMKVFFDTTLARAPLAPGEFFLPSGACRGCHGFDSAGVSNINEAGEDVNLVDRWESSMMALSARDPFWRAKVSQEILVNPSHAAGLQNKCLDCHAPMGAYTSQFHGSPYYSMTDLLGDTLGLDGVSCGGCHAIGPNVGSTYSGIIPYDTVPDAGSYHREYGPFPSPAVGPMQLYAGFTPTYSTHMDQGRLCSSCHTLVTQSVDLTGAYTGGFFVEQATYHEYINSDFPSNSITCQTCHMPKVTDAIVIANGATGLTPRTPFNQHKFAGANVFMLNLIKDNRDTLGIVVPYRSFDSTIVATQDMLLNKSINLDLLNDSTTIDTAYFSVKLENKAGHKFPSGYPSRRAVVQFVVLDGNMDTIFQSGIFSPTFRVNGETPAPAFEPHHDVIKQSNVPQIYEMVMGDVNSNFTSVLERAANLLKDNRLPPVGFNTLHPSYDTAKMSNDALNDADFNKVSSVEGSGIDFVHFHVPVTGAVNNLTVLTKIYYQSVPPKWVDEMFAMSSSDIDKFHYMYDNANQSPFLVASDSLSNVMIPTWISDNNKSPIKVWPTLTMDGRIYISAEYGTLIRSIQVISSDGKLQAQEINSAYQNELTIYLPQTPGVYYLRIATSTKIYYKKVVKS